MVKFSSFFLLVLLLISCGSNSEPAASTSDSTVTDTLAIIGDPKNNLNVQTRTFSEIDSSGILMFPLAIGQPGGDDSYLEYSRSSPVSYWNIIFYNSHNSAHHLLSDRKILISTYGAGYSTSSDNGNAGIALSKMNIFYKVTVEDYNADKKLGPDDPEYLFVSNKEGNNFRQISPPGCQLINWQFIKSTNKIVMTVIKDTDENKKFGDKDEVATFQIDIDKESQPTEIFSADFKKKLKVMFDKDWKQAKQ